MHNKQTSKQVADNRQTPLEADTASPLMVHTGLLEMRYNRSGVLPASPLMRSFNPKPWSGWMSKDEAQKQLNSGSKETQYGLL